MDSQPSSTRFVACSASGDIDMFYYDRFREKEEGISNHIVDNGSSVMLSMNPKLYRAVRSGDIELFRRLHLEDMDCADLEQQVPQGNTVLHIAAHSGNDPLVKCILQLCPDLIKSKNTNGNLPLHIAAAAGNLSTVEILVSADQQQSVSLREKDSNHDTALHLALQNRYEEVAFYLFEADQEVTHYMNGFFKSPLHIAAEAGYAELFKRMMEISAGSHDVPDEESKQRIIMAAIHGKNGGVLDVILEKWPSLVTPDNSCQINPLSLAAFTGYLEGVQKILEKSRHLAYLRHENGFFTIHQASKKGHIQIIQELLKHCPDSIELLNSKKQNILHVAAKYGKSKTVRYMLKNPEFEMLINKKDYKGNTPLHLASEKGHPEVVSDLIWDSRVNLQVLNIKGSTALDVVNNSVYPSYRKRLTWLILRYAGAPQGKNASIMKRHSRNYPDLGPYDNRINTFILVAILVATVAFAAGVTAPNNMTSSLVHNAMFHVFVITNTIAMYSSIIVVVALIWSQLSDFHLLRASLQFAVPVLGLALAMMSIAFTAGVFLIVRENAMLSIFVLVFASIGILTMLVLFTPLFLPSSLPHRILRYVFYYPVLLLIKVTR
ncbi:protein ACCELERATED CELL DEATH 6 [Ziziphus jujuba]|uniref:Protein ACCELERATED CELL DEATH 6 n=1 Tax=Ziziphus jujuba TaxID=326968 RepID=A0A6P4A1S5_ZIZJJ|nr:protein ACCELERATED CELL DEATH 6 [Ziziphus jujuba]